MDSNPKPFLQDRWGKRAALTPGSASRPVLGHRMESIVVTNLTHCHSWCFKVSCSRCFCRIIAVPSKAVSALQGGLFLRSPRPVLTWGLSSGKKIPSDSPVPFGQSVVLL